LKDASKAADLWLPKMDQKLVAAKQLRNHIAGLRQQAHPTCTSILDRDGEEVTEPEQVVEVFRQHYETPNLTSATFDEGHSQHVAQAVAQWASDEGQRVNAKHDGAFTAKEIEEAVKDLPTYKAGDSDELKRLIKAGGTAMETVLLQLFNWLWTGEVMPTAWSRES
jgi:hypothetical protein